MAETTDFDHIVRLLHCTSDDRNDAMIDGTGHLQRTRRLRISPLVRRSTRCHCISPPFSCQHFRCAFIIHARHTSKYELITIHPSQFHVILLI